MDALKQSFHYPRLLSRKPPGPILLHVVFLRHNGLPREPDDNVYGTVYDNVRKKTSERDLLAQKRKEGGKEKRRKGKGK